MQTVTDRQWRQGVGPGAVIHASVPCDASSYGFIACSAADFVRIGGYDEALPYPSGCQDTDLIKRLQGVGLEYIRVSSAALAGFGISNDKPTDSVWRDHLRAKVGYIHVHTYTRIHIHTYTY